MKWTSWEVLFVCIIVALGAFGLGEGVVRQPKPAETRAWTAIDTRTGECLACGSEQRMEVLWHGKNVKIVWDAKQVTP